MQEELPALREEVGFTPLFVTPSIEEALIVGSRIGLLVENVPADRGPDGRPLGHGTLTTHMDPIGRPLS